MFVVMWVNDRGTIWGPFKTPDSASRWAKAHLNGTGWCIRIISKPEK